MVRYELLPVDDLHPHEEVDPERVEELAETIDGDGFIAEPIVVDADEHVILDGHHRYQALRRLGCARIPAYIVDYDDPGIRVTLWDGAAADEVSKAEVIRRGREGDPFPPKTTRHLFEPELERSRVPLSKLS